MGGGTDGIIFLVHGKTGRQSKHRLRWALFGDLLEMVWRFSLLNPPVHRTAIIFIMFLVLKVPFKHSMPYRETLGYILALSGNLISSINAYFTSIPSAGTTQSIHEAVISSAWTFSPAVLH
jgi:hypothetical protein